MKIARYLFQQIFKSIFGFIQFHQFIFNPQMIELLFDENKTNIPLQIYTQKAIMFINTESDNHLLRFSLNHLMANQFTVCFDKALNIEQYFNILLVILTDEGNKFSKVCYKHQNLLWLYNLIVQHTETSKNVSKMVKEIKFYKIEVRDNNLESTKYQLSNGYNPEIKFCICIKELFKTIMFIGGNEFEIKRIN
uniref:Uncharacterized protein n=1 Tax=Meloidogyne enterolobii TaxID=390850 RepID=A0A6V7UEC6_MELEN|nr:unnamed protein product [Meloidogyne enterolobii]